MFNSILYLNAIKVLGLCFILATFFVFTAYLNTRAAKRGGTDRV